MKYHSILKELLHKAENIDEKYLVQQHKKIFNSQEGGSTFNKNKKYYKNSGQRTRQKTQQRTKQRNIQRTKQRNIQRTKQRNKQRTKQRTK
jgi:hypothetical protein